MYSLLRWVVVILASAGCAHNAEKEKAPTVPFLEPVEKQKSFESPSPDFASGEILLWNGIMNADNGNC